MSDEIYELELKRFREEGYMIFCILRGYHYKWKGPMPLKLGDWVHLPDNYVSALRYGRGQHVEEVVGFGPGGYTGPLSTAYKVVDKPSWR